ncbi:MAG TPA: D-glycerate dehydrogenase [Burkholderiales bacterium]|nr:D-glycerate dehydrogenase [Burkholderiales bacterium]
MKPRVLVTRANFPEVLDLLRAHFEVEDNQADEALDTEALRKRLSDKDGALFLPIDRVDAHILQGSPRLKAACNVAVGYNNIDVAACTTAGILVTNTPDVLTETTADLGFALMMAAARRMGEAERHVRAGQWDGWAIEQFLGQDIHGATLGIVGMGRIGQAIARRARGFDMQVLYHNRNRVPEETEDALQARYVSLDDMLREVDFLMLTAPYSAATHHLIGAPQLAAMKPTAVLVNLGRGGVVDDAALVDALRAGTIFAAGLDVYEGEPALHRGFYELENVVLTPHIASATRATRIRMSMTAANNLVAALTGKRPPNLVNPEVWDRRRQ